MRRPDLVSTVTGIVYCTLVIIVFALFLASAAVGK